MGSWWVTRTSRSPASRRSTDAGASHISFLSNSKLRALAAQSQAAALILSPLDDPTVAATYDGARIVTTNPYAYFARAAQYFVSLDGDACRRPASTRAPCVAAGARRSTRRAHIGPHVTVEAGAVIGAGAVIDAGCFIGRDAVIGEGTHLFANVTFHARCVIGARGIIHSGAVIGTDGFGFASEGGVYIKIPQTGRVVIGDDVDIGANTTIDRGALADTVIEDGVKLDNQIQIGHNCHIGAHTAMAGCVGVAGSAKIGKHCTFGGAAMVLGHLTIADNVHISSGSMVSRSILEAGPVHRLLPAGEERRVGKERGHRAQPGVDAREDPRAGKNNQNTDEQTDNMTTDRTARPSTSTRSRNTCRTAIRCCWSTACSTGKLGKSITAIKNVTVNEEFFNGHFPHKPVMPGVLMIEAMAQTAAILSFMTMDVKPDENSVVYFVGIDNARFKRPVEPGDQLKMDVEILRVSRGIWKYKAVGTRRRQGRASKRN